MAKKKTPEAQLLAAFRALSPKQQAEFMRQLRGEELQLHPGVKRMLEKQSRLVQLVEDLRINISIHKMVSEIEQSKVPKKKGKPRRNALILQKLRDGFTPGQLVRDTEVIAANGGIPMKLSAIKKIKERKGK